MKTPNWKVVKEYEDITFKKSDGVARIAFNRPEVRNAFRPKTVFELFEALTIAREDAEVGVILLTGEGPSPKDGGWHFALVEISASEIRAAIEVKTELIV